MSVLFRTSSFLDRCVFEKHVECPVCGVDTFGQILLVEVQRTVIQHNFPEIAVQMPSANYVPLDTGC